MSAVDVTDPSRPEQTRGPLRRILSFDVGIRHMAYCALEHDPRSGHRCASGVTILDWDVIDLDRVDSVEACAERLMAALEARFKGSCFDVVLVERQPKSRSIMMVAVQMLLCGYFSLARVQHRVKSVKFISATRKLALAECGAANDVACQHAGDQSDRQRYAQNKAFAIRAARHYLEHVLADFANLALLEQYTKKDDLCDSLLQAVAFIEGGGACSRVPVAGLQKNAAGKHRASRFRRKKAASKN